MAGMGMAQAQDGAGARHRLAAKAVRRDGRAYGEIRTWEFRTRALPVMDGSCEVCVDGGTAVAVVSVSCDVAKPRPGRPEEGAVEVSVQVGGHGSGNEGANSDPSASGGGTTQEPPTRNRADAIAALVGAAYLPRGRDARGPVDLSSLCVVPHKKVWWLFVHIHIVRDDLATTDSLMAGVYAALRDTTIPLVKPVDRDDGSADAGDDDDNDVALELVEGESTPFAPEEAALISATVHSCGNALYVDPTREELLASEWHVVVTTDREGNACHVRLGGNQSLVTADALADAIAVAAESTKRMRGRVDECAAAAGDGA